MEVRGIGGRARRLWVDVAGSWVRRLGREEMVRQRGKVGRVGLLWLVVAG